MQVLVLGGDGALQILPIRIAGQQKRVHRYNILVP